MSYYTTSGGSSYTSSWSSSYGGGGRSFTSDTTQQQSTGGAKGSDEEVQRLRSKVTELEDGVMSKSSRITELEQELFKVRVESEESVRALAARHSEELNRQSLREEQHLEELRKEFERRKEDDARSRVVEADNHRMELARLEELRDRDRKEAQKVEERLKDALSNAEAKIRAMEDNARAVAAQAEAKEREEARTKAKMEDDFRRELMTLKTNVSRAEEMASSERRAKEKVNDEKSLWEKEANLLKGRVTELQVLVSKLQEQLPK